MDRPSLKKSREELLKKSGDYFIKKYDLLYAYFSYTYGNVCYRIFFLVALLIISFLVFYPIFCYWGYFDFDKNITNFVFVIIFFLSIIFLLINSYHWIKIFYLKFKRRGDRIFVGMFLYVMILIFICYPLFHYCGIINLNLIEVLFYNFVICIFLSIIINKIIKEFYQNKSNKENDKSKENKPWFRNLITSKLSLIFSSYSIQPDIKNVLSLNIPRLMIAITTPWVLIFSFTDEYWFFDFDVNFSEKGNLGILIVLMILLSLFLFYQIKKIVKEISSLRNIVIITQILGYGFIISISVGFIFMNASAEKMMGRNSGLFEFYNKTLYIPNSNKFIIPDENNRINIINALNYKSNLDGVMSDSAIKEYQNDSSKNLSLFRCLQFVTHEDGKTKLLYIIKWSDFLDEWFIHFLDKTGERLRIRQYIKPLIPDEFYILPNMLIKRAIFALFIGMFLELLFKGEKVTEPL